MYTVDGEAIIANSGRGHKVDTLLVHIHTEYINNYCVQTITYCGHTSNYCVAMIRAAHRDLIDSPTGREGKVHCFCWELSHKPHQRMCSSYLLSLIVCAGTTEPQEES